MDKHDNPPAFPLAGWNENGPGGYPSEPGMTLRDWFAGQALSGFAAPAWKSGDWDEAVMARLSYALADAMLAARKRKS